MYSNRRLFALFKGFVHHMTMIKHLYTIKKKKKKHCTVEQKSIFTAVFLTYICSRFSLHCTFYPYSNIPGVLHSRWVNVLEAGIMLILWFPGCKVRDWDREGVLKWRVTGGVMENKQVTCVLQWQRTTFPEPASGAKKKKCPAICVDLGWVVDIFHSYGIKLNSLTY